jgi:hypothetical protein
VEKRQAADGAFTPERVSLVAESIGGTAVLSTNEKPCVMRRLTLQRGAILELKAPRGDKRVKRGTLH